MRLTLHQRRRRELSGLADLTLKFNHYRYRSEEDDVKKTVANQHSIVPRADDDAVFDNSAARLAPLVHKRIQTRTALTASLVSPVES